jgi:uncharacterized protein
MTTPLPSEDRINTLPDRYIPVYQVYFARDVFTPNLGATGAPNPNGTLLPAIAAEAARIQSRVVSTDPSQPAPPQGPYIPLAGRYGVNPNQQTNDVISVEFKEDLEGNLATVVVDVFNVFNFESQLYRYTDDAANPQGTGPLLDYGVTLALFFGYQNASPNAGVTGTPPSNVSPVFEGVITKLDLTFPADTAPTVKVTATDKRDRLRAQKGLKLTPYKNQTEEAIAADVAAKFGLAVATRPNQTTKTMGTVQLSPDQDAMTFLADRAKKAQLEMLCFGNTILLTTPGDAGKQTPLLYEYRRGLTSFSTSFDGTGKPTSVKLTARDPATQQTFTTTVTVKDLITAGLVPSGSTAADVIQAQGQGGSRLEVVTNYHATSQDEVQNLALGILKTNIDSSLTASGEVIGDPAVRAGVLLDIQGVGSHYSGLYYVTSATHTFGANGYQTSFTARRNIAPGATGGNTTGGGST